MVGDFNKGINMKKFALLLLLPTLLLSQDLQEPVYDRFKESSLLLENRPEHTTYTYMSSGFTSIISEFEGIVAPNIGVGVRGKFQDFGHDCSVNLGVGTTTEFKDAVPFITAKGQVFYYFSEKPNSLFAGISGEAVFVPTAPVIFPYGEFLLGVEWKKNSGKNSFITLGVNPILLFDPMIKIPIITLNYGYSF